MTSNTLDAREDEQPPDGAWPEHHRAGGQEHGRHKPGRRRRKRGVRQENGRPQDMEQGRYTPQHGKELRQAVDF